MTGKLISAGIGAVLGKRNKKRGSSSVPRNIDTGRSTFDTRKGNIRIDPNIRAGLDRFRSQTQSLIPEAEAGFDRFDEGLRDLTERSGDIQEGLEGNQSAFRESILNPVRERLALREGALEKELGRTGVRGSFANQARTNFSRAAGRELSDTEAQIENQRLNRLGDFLGLDADLLKQGLASDTGRIQLLAGLEESLRSVSTEEFDRELSLLGLPGQFVAGNAADARNRGIREGESDRATLGFVGELFDFLG